MSAKRTEQSISNMKPLNIVPGQTLEIPKGYRPFYFPRLNPDGAHGSYFRAWPAKGSEEEASRVLRAIELSEHQSLKPITPRGPLKYKTAHKFRTKLGNFSIDGKYLFVSDRAKSIIDKYDCGNIEFFSISIEMHKKVETSGDAWEFGFHNKIGKYNVAGGGAIVEGYWLINFISSEDVIDYNNSEIGYKIFPNNTKYINDYNKLFLIKRPHPYALYKVNGMGSEIYLNSKLKDELRSSGFPFSTVPKYSLAAGFAYNLSEDNSIAADALT